jgi:O-methyltransferase involved in polyketide biosynthesis
VIAFDLPSVAKTLLVPLACRAYETARQDALLRDPRAVDVFEQIGGGTDCLMGISNLDQMFTVMRAHQFDCYARAFLASHPMGLIVDIGCGLDTRFYRLDNGEMAWLGLDLPEVIDLRRRFLPDGDRCQTVACSLLDLRWLDYVEGLNKPAIFLAEGVFPYFKEAEIKAVLTAMASVFCGCEIVFDALSVFSTRLHRINPVLRKTGAQLYWGVDNPHQLEVWGLCLLDQWGYFDKHELRLGLANLLRYIPPLNHMNYILRFRFGERNKGL